MKKLFSVITSCVILFAVILESSCFTIDIVSRDDPNSPSYNPSSTPHDRLAAAVRRSFVRAKRFRAMVDLAAITALSEHAPISSKSTEVIVDDGQYLMNVSIGTPPFQIIATADTGSDFLWTQCKPCTECYAQNTPLFNPKTSSSYHPISCQSPACAAMPRANCGENKTCRYFTTYGDGSTSEGDIAVDTVTIGAVSGRPVSLTRTLFGCGYINQGAFEQAGSGIVGLGGGELSVISQMKGQMYGKFSYCLIPQTHIGAVSRMNFGNHAALFGPGAVSTPMVPKAPASFYYMTLNGFTVRNHYVKFTAGLSGEPSWSKGNIIIDSGTTLTLLPSNVYSELEAALKSIIKGNRVESPEDHLRLCYKSSPGHDVHIPPVTCHFDGADVVLQRVNMFLHAREDIICLSLAPSDDISIFGNLAQANIHIGYDLFKKTITFKHADCAKI